LYALIQEALVLDTPLYFRLTHGARQRTGAPARKGCRFALPRIGLGIVLKVGRRGRSRAGNEHQTEQSRL
jgi:hypothetical protein